jgi:hypothetical protein
MKSAQLGTSAAVAFVFGFGLTAWLAAEETAGPVETPVEEPAAAPGASSSIICGTAAAPRRSVLGRREPAPGSPSRPR